MNDKKELAAFCTSHKCAGEKPRVEKIVEKYKSSCPDCSSILVWRPRGRTNLNLAENRRYIKRLNLDLFP